MENLRNRAQRRCTRSGLPRLVAISVIVLIVLLMSIVYHGLVLDRMDKLRQIVALNRKHYHMKNPTDSGLRLAGTIQLLSEEGADIVDKADDAEESTFTTSDEHSLRLKHLRAKYVRHHRVARHLSDVLDPIRDMQNVPDFKALYAKVRNKRGRIQLSQLENEYQRCKKETTRGNDCMVAFVRMYKIVKDISDKMEKMKAMFKDSELVLQQSTDSQSLDSKESNDSKHDFAESYATKTTNNGADQTGNKDEQNKKSNQVPVITTQSGIVATKPGLITTSTPEMTTMMTTTTMKAIKTLKVETQQISWIIDGNDNHKEHFVHLEDTAGGGVAVATTTTVKPIKPMTTTTATPTTISTTSSSAATTTTTTTTTTSSATTTTNATTTTATSTAVDDNRHQFAGILHGNGTFRTTTLGVSTTDLTDLTTTASAIRLDSTKPSETTLTTTTTAKIAVDSVTRPLNGTAESIEHEEEEKLRRLKFSWILDEEDDEASESNQNTTSTTTHTTIDAKVTYPTTPKHSKFDWIIDSEVMRSEGHNISDPPSEVKLPAKAMQIADLLLATTRQTFAAGPGGSEVKAVTRPYMAVDHTNPEQAEINVHPLDDPSSLENMLESFEEHEQVQPVLHEHKHSGSGLNASTPAGLYDRKQWEKLFEGGVAVKHQQDLIDTSLGEIDDESVAKIGRPQFNPANTQVLSASDTQFMTLCERMAKRLHNKGAGSPGSQFDSPSQSITQSPGRQFTSRGPGGGFPVTGETMKASAQFMYNPNFGMPIIPFCFYVTPASFRMLNQAPMWSSAPYYGVPGNYGGSSGPFVGGGIPGGVVFMPQNFGTSPQFFGPSAVTSGGSPGSLFTKNASPQNKQQFFCTYMPNHGTNSGQNSGAGAASSGNVGSFKMRDVNQSSPMDIIYASYSDIPIPLGREDSFECEVPGQMACYGGHECIREAAWCDGVVDCSDGSDEAACTCRDRLIGVRICDGYPDCPMGEDEIGCFGCKPFMYSCYDNVEDFERLNRSTLSMCYSRMEKCDGIENCLNGKDELECNLIVSDVLQQMSHSVSLSEGYLYHNHRGQWYPVCNNAEVWAKQACDSESIGFGEPNITYRAISLSGPFIEPSLRGHTQFPQSCQKRATQDNLADHAVYVRCPPAKCGTTKTLTITPQRARSKRLANAQEQQRKTELEEVNERVVGGRYSKPLEWPFVVAIYRNGNFHCGGTILSEYWIISAAHCVINYQKYYYDVRAGQLRRSSYATSTQIRSVSYIIVHQGYERRSMRNDMSMLHLAEPLKFNRWVKPVCLPDQGRTTLGNDWVWGPEEGTVCMVVGWGAIREKGPGSDQLREVTVPIRKNCTEKEDQEAEDVCAGDVNGGRDACQGDSGGPLFCRSMSNLQEWYLLGIVSHGNGCARPGEYGAYTRVTLYLDWIDMAMRAKSMPILRPQQECPGYVCVWGGRRCIVQRKRCDRFVDCLGGEDEVGCIYNFIPDVGSAANTTTTESDYYLQVAETPAPLDFVGSARNFNPSEPLTKDAEEEDAGNETIAVTTQMADVDTTKQKQETAAVVEVSEVATTTTFGTTTATTETTTSVTTATSTENTTLTTTTLATTTMPESIDVTTQSSKLDSATDSLSGITTESPEPFEPITTIATTTPALASITVPAAGGTTGMGQASHDASSTESGFSSESSTSTAPTGKEVHFNDATSTLSILTTTTTTTTATTTHPPNTEAAATDATTTVITTAGPTAKFGQNFEDVKPILPITVQPQPNKPENATSNAALPSKFLCRRIKQIIDIRHRCDRIVDCEDGTDEVGCTCRDYLKGPLDILVCDGKTDCEDMTDEEDCGNCSSVEFLCPLSKECLPLDKRCDNTIDCKFKEDEKDCFALTNGKEMLLDSNKQPALSHVGIFSRNMHGVWRVVCSHETTYHKHSAKTAADVCALLGFKGFRFYNTTEFLGNDHIVPIEPEIAKRPRFKAPLAPLLADNLHLSSAEQVQVGIPQPERFANQACLGLYVECHARSNRTLPLKTLSAGVEITHNPLQPQKLKPQLNAHNKPHVQLKPHVPATLVVVHKKDEIFDKLDKVMDGKKNSSLMVHHKLHEAIEDLHWPWLVDIYMGGKLWCLGVLVDKHWVMVHQSCNYGIRWNVDYVTALFGGGKSKDHPHKSPNEQIRRVNCYELVPSSDVLLYHLEQPVRFSHYVLPTFLPEGKHNKSVPHECMAVLHDNLYGRTKAVSISREDDDAFCQLSELTCYRLLESKPPAELLRLVDVSAEDMASVSEEVALKPSLVNDVGEERAITQFTSCRQFGSKSTRSVVTDAIDQGILFCRDADTGWYPLGLFDYNNTDCSRFKEPFGIRTLEKIYQALQAIIDQPKCSQGIEHATPTCHTHRCALGACLEDTQICNGQRDCHDGSDEHNDMCVVHKKACAPSELKCHTSHKCIPKTKFCDHVPDCEDLTDEPTICSCFTYLQATDPAKICDGVRNCWDKSDESPAFCNCTADHFQCGGSGGECVPRDFVCDKETDCPNGDDEKYCFGIERPTSTGKHTTYGQVIEQTYGVWHTKCFPRDSPPNASEVRQICKKLGYNPYKDPAYRLIDDAASEVRYAAGVSEPRGRTFGDEALLGKYRASTKAVIASRFSALRLNEEFTLLLKSSRPIAELVHWNATDSSKCFRMEIKCA